MHALSMTLAGCLALAIAAATPAADSKKIDPGKLVGTWAFAKTTRKEAPPPGNKQQFTKDGKVTFTLSEKGKVVAKFSGTYKVKGDRLTVTMKGPDGKDGQMTATIKELTDKKLVITYEAGGEKVTDELKK